MLQQVAGFLYGVDIDQEALRIYRQRSGDEQNAIYDIQTQNEIPGFLNNEYDLILFSEVLEHLPHPFLALQNLHRLSVANGGAILCVTVPNAFSFTGFYAAMQGVERRPSGPLFLLFTIYTPEDFPGSSDSGMLACIYTIPYFSPGSTRFDQAWRYRTGCTP